MLVTCKCDSCVENVTEIFNIWATTPSKVRGTLYSHPNYNVGLYDIWVCSKCLKMFKKEYILTRNIYCKKEEVHLFNVVSK